ncbi:GNAT family N-acetyltransferase [Mobilitalea sibirica]|uniref:GNAT family N-acetyltransferase n=1 Tax=Mobilitalea sibirica TaxID=1462919 RepID=A0A8J7HBT8_9FIRM|nr:GNAT family N-acetyltransferase [Mobilitalea sibirica]MBH1941885.1 GNAT family N-acetyltransferase [Mobilitalea sibirica]
MEVKFRIAHKNDLEEVISLYNEAIAHMLHSKIYQWDERYPNEEVLTEDIEKNELYVLTEKDKIIACVVINEDQDASYHSANWKYVSDKIAIIHRLCVHPRAQRKGIGKLLMKCSEEWICQQEYEAIRLDTFTNNHIARKLYEGLGYSYVGEVTFRKGVFLLMEKKI